MAKLQRRTLFRVALEQEYGTDPNSTYRALMARQGSEVSTEGEKVTRDTLRNTLSPRGHVIGLKDQSITMPLELRGAGTDNDALSVPEIDELLKASLMQREGGVRLVVSSASGTFARGETLTNDTATVTVGTVADWDSENSILYVRDLQNAPTATDTVSGDTSNATATVSSVADAYVYRPQSPDVADMPSVTAHYFVDGTRHRILGARSSFDMTLTVGQIPTISFSMQGVYEQPTEVGNPSLDYLELTPQPVFGAGLIVGALDMSKVTVNEVSVNLGNNLEWRNDMKAAAGRHSVIITERDPTGTVDPEAISLSDFNPYEDWEQANEVAMAVGIGTGEGNRIRVVMPTTQYTELPYAERNGIVTRNLGFRATGDDNELMIIYS